MSVPNPNAITIPTIGIGAGPNVDGQILVINDILGYDDTFEAKFVRKYADVGTTIRDASRRFVEDVRSGSYPSKEETY